MENRGKPVRKLLIVDDHLLFREGLASLFQSTPDFEVVGQAGCVQEAVELACHHRPDIILMDFSLPDGTGLDATEAILAELPACRIIFLTVYETDENIATALYLGARGYMLKNVSSSALLAGLRALDQDEIAMSRKMMSKALEFSHSARYDPRKGLAEKLSPREVDILLALEGEASNSEIASSLYLSQNTVKHHIRNILDKLGVANRHEAGMLARQLGIKKSKAPANI
jgi:DNA-binding NarL/FixJ family response regulator